MIVLKTSRELERMRRAGELSAQALMAGVRAVQPGKTSLDIDRVVHDYIVSHGGKPSFLGYNGFPASTCVSINEEVIHGIPSRERVIREGDLVSIDVGAILGGYQGDNAFTVAAGAASAENAKLLEVTQKSLELAIAQAVPGNHLRDIGAAVENYVSGFGYGIVREYVGHGIGTEMHEDPEVPNYATPRRGPRLLAGMTLAIEPMITLRGDEVKTLSNGWTVVTESGLPAAHFEHTVAITDNGPVILTPRDFG